MNYYQFIKVISKVLAIILATFFLLTMLSCFSAVPEQSALAQANQKNTSLPEKELIINVLQGTSDPCSYQKPGFDLTSSSDFKLYELVNAGYPKEISIDDAVAVFNNFMQCNNRGKSQPPLTADELIAAIRDWDCTKEKDATNKKLCADAWKITETGKMPKGSFIDADCGIAKDCKVRSYKGYDVNAWEIDLYLWLDKYRRDMKDEPIYSHLIRLKYLSSEPRQSN